MSTDISNTKQINASLATLLILVSLTAGFGGGWLGARSNNYSKTTANTQAQKRLVV